MIIQGIKPNIAVEVGIDISVQSDRDLDGTDFFLKNSGPGKYFIGGPICRFRSKDVPTIIRWSNSCSITSGIPVDTLKSLNNLGIYHRDDNHPKPFLQLNGHQSHFQLPFLQYINQPEDNWVVCIGVPYGTALWQVKDSKEQNGSFNMSTTKSKIDLLELKEKSN